MLSYDIHDLRTRAATVSGSLSADDPVWQDDDPRPVGSVRATGRLSSAGSGRYYWHGRIEAAAEVACRRCLTPLSAAVAEEVHVFFAEAGDTETDDPDVYRLPAGARAIDLRGAIREQWLLGVPAFALCRDDCKGLCPTCGTDLNTGACTCPPDTDRRWDALRASRARSD